MRKATGLAVVLYVDFFITFCFGVASWLYPQATYGTIVLLEEAGPSLVLSLLSTLSLFYVLVGLCCLAGARMPYPYNTWIALVMIVRHLWAGIAGIRGAENEWVIGNPWQDVVIHSLFVLFYVFLTARVIRREYEAP